MAKHLVGLDIGSRFVKAVQLTEEGGRMTMTEYGIEAVAQPEQPEPAIAALFGRKSFKNKRINVGVSGRSVFVRYVPMPKMSEEELVNASKYELGKYIPIEVDEVIHDCKKLEEPGEGDSEMKVVLVAARKAFVDKRIELVDRVGLYPNIIDVECFALGNAYEKIRTQNAEPLPEGVPASGGGCIAIVEIGASKSNVVILNNNVCQFTREFYKGGDDMTDVLSKKLGCDMATAEALKRDAKDDAMKVQAAIEDVIDDLCQDAKISIDFFENQNDMTVDEVKLTGGSCGIVGLKEAMEKMIGKPLEIWNPIEQFPLALSQQSEAELRASAWQCGVALGLAVRES